METITKSTRDLKQEEVIKLWSQSGSRSTLVAPTGFGKSRVGKLAIEEIKQIQYDNYKVILVVPLTELKNQWEEHLRNWKLDKLTEVLVINTACKNNYECDLLILDEIHRVGAPEFSKVLQNIKYSFVLGLTATLERSDGKHVMIEQYAPVIAEVTMDECVKNGWVSPFVVYNLEVDFTEVERIQYKKAENSFKYAAMQCGFGSQAFKNAQSWLKSGTTQQKGFAGMYFNSMRKRKELILSSVNKPLYVREIVNKFPDRMAVVFNETIEAATEVNRLLGDTAVLFHSKMKKSEREEALRLFKDRRNKQRVISSVKALQEGFDYPHCSLGIIAAGTSITRTAIQATGRLIRFVEDKRAIIVNLYIKDSQDFYWVRSRTKDQKPVWIKSLDEIV